MPTAPFDITDNAVQAYRQIWAERHYLLRLAIVPVLVKFVCAVVVMSLNIESELLLQGLAYLPSYFTEGWMLAHLVRLVFLEQRWPFRPSGDNVADEALLRERFRGVMGGMLTYVLASFLLAGFMHLFMMSGTYGASDKGSANIVGFMISLVLMGRMLWGFRLFWAFVPAALNYPVRDYLYALGGMRSSFYMLGTWLISFLPIVFLYLLFASFIMGMIGVLSAEMKFVFALGQIVAETASMMVSTVGIGFAIRAMMKPKQ